MMLYLFCQTMSLSVNLNQFHRQMKDNSKHKNVLINKWLEILAEGDLPPKETPPQREERSVLLTVLRQFGGSRNAFVDKFRWQKYFSENIEAIWSSSFK